MVVDDDLTSLGNDSASLALPTRCGVTERLAGALKCWRLHLLRDACLCICPHHSLNIICTLVLTGSSSGPHSTSFFFIATIYNPVCPNSKPYHLWARACADSKMWNYKISEQSSYIPLINIKSGLHPACLLIKTYNPNSSWSWTGAQGCVYHGREYRSYAHAQKLPRGTTGLFYYNGVWAVHEIITKKGIVQKSLC